MSDDRLLDMNLLPQTFALSTPSSESKDRFWIPVGLSCVKKLPGPSPANS